MAGWFGPVLLNTYLNWVERLGYQQKGNFGGGGADGQIPLPYLGRCLISTSRIRNLT